MKKPINLIITLVLLLISDLLFSQDPNDIPKIFPASPEASNLGRFGEIPVNLSVGMANFSVPVYTIEEPGFQLPISVNYQHNGLVVDQIPGHLGMGWSLSSGGMITRQMKGRPDEDPAGYIGNQMTGKNIVIPYINNLLTPQRESDVNQLASENLIDLQPDKFIASAGNMNVTFYFDENRNPVIKPYKPYKIEFINNDFSLNQGIKITDDNGIQYFFQEKETTKRTLPISLGEIAGSMRDGYTSGWKLSRVVLINNEEITFNYDATLHYQSTKSQSFKEWIEGDSNCFGSPLSTSTRNYEITSKIIKNITFPKGKIEFENTIVTLSDNNDNKNRYLSHLDKIHIINQSDKLINTYDFYYDDLNKTRKLLTQVRINNDTKNLYDFEYYGSPPDNINFYKQDFWGYYNSNPNNFLINSYNTFDVYGGRKPDFEKTRIGALKKIIYPTKGSSEIEYELNSVEAETNSVPYTCQNAELEVVGSRYVGLNWLEQNGGESYKTESLTFTVEEGLQYVSIYMNLKKIANGNNPFQNFVYGKASASLTNIDGVNVGCADIQCYSGPPGEDGCDGVFRSIGGPTHFSPGEKSLSRRYRLKPGTYILKVEVQNYGVQFDTGMVITASATVSKETAQETTTETAGIRISKIKNCPNNSNSECIEKEYLYEDENGTSYGKLFRKRNITKYRLNEVNNTIGNGVCGAIYDVYSSSSNVPLGYFTGSHVFYDTVIERIKGSNNSYLGFTKKEFICSPVEQNLTFPFLDVDNKEFKNGKPLKEEIYNNSSPIPISTKEYRYDFDGDGTPLNSINQRVYILNIGVSTANNTESGSNGYTSNNTIFRNNIDREWLTTEISTELLNNSNLIRIKNYNYSNPQGHIQEQEVIDSRNESYKTSYEYPYTLNSTINNDLIIKNRVATPLKITVTKNDFPLSNQETSYREWSSNIISPEYIKSSKNENVLENRLQYYDYDDQGNPLEVSKADGAHISYIWGYNKQYPVAKVENATRAEIEALSGFGADFHTGSGGLTAVQETRLRSLPNAMVSTYLYEPLIGVTSMTDPRGYTMTYHYDEFNRLKFVKDADGNLVSENQYNYKN
ncbi:RHS repeat protein [Aquimarina sp. MMG015]|uniref:RHS repeat domain-containing protein n=1 Tax=Aquimarina sp. MMG015 TaxID=2822689 RepID=UPI001B3A4644|nr:RHS repeat domain-containing protein [Aquimarina sp. MMG015]MBQ4805412.1 RHS repeat protein [Aquimarina sp. MMG015]